MTSIDRRLENIEKKIDVSRQFGGHYEDSILEERVASTKSALVAAFKELKAGSRGRKTLSFSFNNEPLGGDIDALMNALPLVDGISFDVILEILGISSVACASSVDDANTFANILNSLKERERSSSRTLKISSEQRRKCFN